MIVSQPFLTYAFINPGVAIGAGMQGKAAYINIICYYAVGVPVGVFLAHVAHLQVKVSLIREPCVLVW